MAVSMDDLKEVLEFVKRIEEKSDNKNIVDKMVGRFRGIIPAGKNSIDFIKEMRESQYDYT